MENEKTQDKIDELIEKQEKREHQMKQVREDYIEKIKITKKQITVKIFPKTNKK